jgi:dephospho-CoA kinase
MADMRRAAIPTDEGADRETQGSTQESPLGATGPGGSRTVVLGVLGGIASGKSRVAAALAGSEGVVVSADALAHEALADPEIRARVAEAFGAHVLDADGAVDRPALARVVFSDPAARRRLEGWIHPYVRARIWAALEEARRTGRPRVVLDVPLLLENDAEHGLARASDHFVDVDAAERDRRAVRTRGWSPGEVARREAAQLPLAEKRRRSDVVVQNDGTLAELDAAIAAALAELGLG